MRCQNCDGLTEEKIGRYHYTECGLDNVWLLKCRMRVCPKCSSEYPELPDADVTAKAVAKVIMSSHFKLDGDSVLFLRKLMMLTAEQLAALLGSNRVAISRWENDKHEMSALYDFRLRLIAVERLFPVDEQVLLNQEINRVIRVAYRDELDELGLIEVPSLFYQGRDRILQPV